MAATTGYVFNTIRSLAEYFGVSVSTVKRRIKDGTLPVYRLGPRSVRIKLEDAEAAFQAKVQS